MNTAENVHYLPGHEPNQEADQSAGRGSGAQLEDGYVRTANDIVEGLMKAPLTSRESRIIRAVERATYGWQRSSARLSQSVLAEMTGLTAKRCSEAVNSLLKKKVLFRDGGSQSPIGINTRVSEWDFSTEKSKNVPNLARDTNWGQSPQTRDEKRPQNRDTNKDRKDNPLELLRSSPESSREDTESESSKYVSKKLPDCPHQRIIEQWAEVMPEKRQPMKSMWSGARAKNLATRWKEGFSIKNEHTGEPLYTDTESGIEWWGRFFRFLRRSEFLMRDENNWFGLDWVAKRSNFEKIMELTYHGGEK